MTYDYIPMRLDEAGLVAASDALADHTFRPLPGDHIHAAAALTPTKED